MNSLYRSNRFRNTATLLVYHGLRVLMLAAAGIFLWRGDWESAVSTVLIFFLTLVPAFLKQQGQLHLPFLLDLWIVLFIFLTLFLGEVGRFYDHIPAWDKFLHFQSGLLLGANGYAVVYSMNEHKKMPLTLTPGFLTFFSIVFALAIGAVWEIIEFAVDQQFGTSWQHDNSDTMWDLVADGLGALAMSGIGYFWMHRHKRLPFTPWLLRILRRKGPQA